MTSVRKRSLGSFEADKSLWVQSNMVWDFVIAKITISCNGTDSYSEFVC